MKSLNRGRQAYTLLELLLTLGIVATLAGLLLPAVAMAREMAARASCQNNLHQIGVAFQHCHDTYGSMPPGIGYWPGYQAYGTALYHVLPFLEQEDLYKSSFVVNGFGWAGYNGVAAQPVKTFVCPSDPTAGDGTVWGANEQIASGTNNVFRWDGTTWQPVAARLTDLGIGGLALV